MKRRLLLLCLLASCSGASTDGVRQRIVTAPLERPDIVVFVVDDVADTDIDVISLPNIEGLALEGVRFRRAYSHAWCAPTRDSWTYGTELGFDRGDACVGATPETAAASLTALAESLKSVGYETCHVGKWHHGSAENGPWELAYLQLGFDAIRHGQPVGDSSCSGVNLEDGAVQTSGQGGDTAACRDALLAWWATAPSPKFAIVNFAAGHSPFQFPPPAVLPPGYPRPPSALNREKYEAEIVAVDFVIGEILGTIDPEVVVFCGDNGTPGNVPGQNPMVTSAVRQDQDPNRVKLTCYEDGIRVPLIVVAPNALGGTQSEALVSMADLPNTLCELASAPTASFQAPSFAGCLSGAPSKRLAVVSWSRPELLACAVTSERWKLLRRPDGVEELYDLLNDPTEEMALPATGDEADALRLVREKFLDEG